MVIGLFSFSAFLAYLFSISPLSSFTPQAIALISVIIIITLKQKKILIYLITLLISLIIFTSNGLNSPVFFLIYFLLFIIAFQNPPSTTLSFSIVLIILLSQYLNSVYSLIPLLSLLLITPLAWFVGRQYLENRQLDSSLIKDETDVLLWFSLKFKTGITQIIDTASQLLSQPQMTHTQKEQVRYIKNSAKNLLNSSQKLTHEIDKETDES